MIEPAFFIEKLKENGIGFFAGVPDSLLKNICAYITDHVAPENTIIAANEGAAVGLATGYHLATGKIPVVYMQNSGIGNSVNPLLSLTDKEVYNIPLLLLVGWRGEPGVKDEPQHIKQGKITIPLLDSMGIKNKVLAKDTKEFCLQLQEAITYIKETGEAFAFIIRKDTFDTYKTEQQDTALPLRREEAIQLVTSAIAPEDVVVSTTGMISRELFEYREARQEGHAKDFLTVGSMGHASQIALGIALQDKRRKVFCFDGDGAALMHMGSMGITGSLKPSNYIHIIFNNGVHDSVGGQPTVGFQVDFPAIAKAAGYVYTRKIVDKEKLLAFLPLLETLEGPALIEIQVARGSRKDLGRPTTTPVENKQAFMDFLNEKR